MWPLDWVPHVNSKHSIRHNIMLQMFVNLKEQRHTSSKNTLRNWSDQDVASHLRHNRLFHESMQARIQTILENVAINDVLPLKAARRNAIANWKCFGASDTRGLISMDIFTFTMRCHLIRLASAPFTSSHLATFDWVRFRLQRVGSTMQNLRRVGENSDFILSRLWTKVHEIFRECRKPLVLSNALFRLSASRFVQKIVTIKFQSLKNGANAKVLWLQLLWEGWLRHFYGSLLGRLTTHYLAQFGWLPFADVPLLSLAMKQNAEFAEGG